MLKMFSIRLFMFISCLVSVLVSAREEQCEILSCECFKDERGLEYHCPNANWHRKLIIKKPDIEKLIWHCWHLDDMDKYIPNFKLYAKEMNIINCLLTREAAKNIDSIHVEEIIIIDSRITSGFVEILNNDSYPELKKITLRSVKLDENVTFINFLSPKLERLELRYVDIQIARTLFEEQTTLKDLDLSANHIKNLDVKIFEVLFDLRTLDLAKNNLTSLNSDTFEGLYQLDHLYLEDNSIQFLGKGVFRDLKRLVTLDISKNNICFFYKDILKPLQALKVINLSNNDGLELDNYVFSNFPELRNIEIASLNMKKIPENIFWGSNNITHINLEKNLLFHIPPLLFDGLSNLIELNMRNNDIKTLDSAIFRFLVDLVSLDLSWNKIERLTSELLKPLINLQYINLSSNQINYIEDRCFWNKSNLRHIYLSHNNYKYSVELKTTPARSPFDECPHLLTLDLGFNLIEDIPWYLLKNIKYLESLILAGNKIKYLDLALVWKIAYKGLHLNLKDNEISKVIFNKTVIPQEAEDPVNEEASLVYLANNPLNCDCDAFNYLNFIETVMKRSAEWGISFIFDHLKCASPKNLEGMEFKLITAYDPNNCRERNE